MMMMMLFFPRFLLFFYIFGVAIIICFATSPVFGDTLVLNEVEALKKIGDKLRKYWDFNVDPCSGQSGQPYRSFSFDGYENSVSCNCSGTLCHVVAIILREQDLQGVLPTELVELPYLQIFDVTRNYLSGPIPPEWGSTKLVNISVLGNRLTGPIPKEIGNISTLTSFVVEVNQLSGVLPAELGNLPRIERLFLNSNNFTGELNESFAKLTTLQDVRLGDNNFTGKIPDFITKWSNLTKLVIQGSGFNGPIPSDIRLLTKMTDLRISDLNGAESPFPQLDNMTGLVTLMLRSCNIYGQLPKYFAQMTRLKSLDLSFNNLRGEIPSDYSRLVGSTAIFIYLTGNLFTGPVPAWTLEGGQNVDLSYNNFTDENVDSCQRGSMNLFGSSLKGNKSGISCLGEYVCPKMQSYFHINCGGKALSEGNITYEDDSNEYGASNFYRNATTNWAFSSTGYFPDDDRNQDLYTLRTSSPSVPSRLYLDARLSPLSLTYYGFCLRNGDYTVKLHFAEIKFTDDKTYNSLGRRIFDVYIQGELVMKDFNIANAAGGVDKEFVYSLLVPVTNNTLEIRLHWAGKGTTAIPVRGVFGPLISAISAVRPDYRPPENNSVSAGAVVGIVGAVAVVVLLILGVLWWKNKENRANQNVEVFLKNTGSFAPKRYSYSSVKRMTNSFKDELGKGGFGCVYRGKLNDDCLVAVKILNNSKGKNGEEFMNELASISRTSHVNIVNLLGFCFDGSHRALIYEFMPNGSLEKFIYDEIPMKSNRQLGWETLYKIAIGIARGLEYLHRGCNTRILHFDIKPHNILLDDDFCPKISDFGLAKLCPKRESVVSMLGARGTAGYIAPEVYCRNIGEVSHKVDVYSFGMMVLEMVGGRKNINVGVGMDHTSQIYFPHWIYNRIESNSELGLRGVEIIMDEEENEKARKMILVSLWCIQTDPSNRPPMSRVLEMLEGKLESLQIPPKPFLSSPSRAPPDSSTMKVSN